MGWIRTPSPVTALADLAADLGLGSLAAKRDDLLDALHGGTKVRKFDTLLAAEPWRDARRLTSVGAIGSGHVQSLAEACVATEREFVAHVFWQPPSRGVLDNLAASARLATRLTYSANRLELLARHPLASLGMPSPGTMPVPAGGTCAPGTLGTILAGVELAEQIAAGVTPLPDRIYVPFGSGGTAAGIAAGLGWAGLRIEVHGVAVVERVFATRTHAAWIIRGALNWLKQLGISPPPGFEPAPLRLRRGFLGPRYGVATEQSTAAADRLVASGVPAEDVYSGKAMACLLADAPSIAGRDVLFWVTPRRALDGGVEGAAAPEQSIAQATEKATAQAIAHGRLPERLRRRLAKR